MVSEKAQILFQVVVYVKTIGERIIISVVDDPLRGTAEEERLIATPSRSIKSDQRYDWDEFHKLNLDTRPWLVDKVFAVLDKESHKRVKRHAAQAAIINKGMPVASK